MLAPMRGHAVTATLRAAGADPVLRVLLVGYFALQPLATDLYLASLPALAPAFATSAERAQQTLTLFMAAFGVAQLVAGPLSDRFGRRPVLTAGVAVFALTSGLALVVTSIDAFLGLRVAQAAAAACCIVAGRALVRDRYAPVAGAPLLATVTAWTATLSVAGPILGGYLEATAGYRGSFLVMTLFAAAVFAFHWRHCTESLRHPAPIAPAALARGLRETLRNGCFWAFTLLACASFAGLFAFMAASPRLFIAGYGMAPAHYGYIYGVAVLGLLAGNVACRRLLPRFGIVGVVRGAALLALAGALCFALAARGTAPGVVLLLLPFCAYMMAHGMLMPCIYAGVAAGLPARAGLAIAVLGALQMALAAWVGQAVDRAYDATAWPLALAILGAAVVTFVVANVLLVRHRKLL